MTKYNLLNCIQTDRHTGHTVVCLPKFTSLKSINLIEFPLLVALLLAFRHQTCHPVKFVAGAIIINEYAAKLCTHEVSKRFVMILIYTHTHTRLCYTNCAHGYTGYLARILLFKQFWASKFNEQNNTNRVTDILRNLIIRSLRKIMSTEGNPVFNYTTSFLRN